ncbi:MAG: hypothetical protein P8Q97_06900 [Myxococcota bacterium]|nr:hypothetical protein [Myxococcota bacterium]
MKIIYWLVGAVVAVPVILVAMIYGVSEVGGEVVTLLRPESDGSHSNVRIWVVDDGDVSWIEHGEPDSYWLGQLEQIPQLTLIREGQRQNYRATADPAAHEQYHRLRYEKYGIADDIVAKFSGAGEDCSAVPIRLDLKAQSAK